MDFGIINNLLSEAETKNDVDNKVTQSFLPRATSDDKGYIRKMKIVRYLDFQAAINVLNQHSTFCLRGLRYYQNLECRGSDTSIGDKQENRSEFEDTGGSFESGAAVMVSCWSILNYKESLDWEMFPEYSKGIAIVSSVDRVKDLLQNNMQNILENWKFKDRKIQYYKKAKKPKDYYNSVCEAPFWKRDTYKTENEYRFAYISSSLKAKLQTLIFYVENPENYIDEIHLSPNIDKPEHKQLICGAIETNMVSKIHNRNQEIEKFKS